MQTRFRTVAVAGLCLAFSSAAAPAFAQGNRQGDKNNMRNLAVGLGALAAQQGLQGKTTEALILGAGAAYAAKKYEDSRKAQGREETWRSDRYDDGRLDDRRYDRRYDERYDDRYDGRYDDRYRNDDYR